MTERSGIFRRVSKKPSTVKMQILMVGGCFFCRDWKYSFCAEYHGNKCLLRKAF